MIFVTVGSELPYDRMLNVVDQWASNTGKKVLAQIGPSGLTPEHMKWSQFISPDEFQTNIESAEVVIAHARMRSILSAMQNRKPIIIMPRRAQYRETRNDHQVATANKMKCISGVYVAMDENELLQHLEQIHALSSGESISTYASKALLTTIENFINA